MTTLLQVGLEIEKVLDVAAYTDNTHCCNWQSLNWLHLRLQEDSFDELIVSNETYNEISLAHVATIRPMRLQGKKVLCLGEQ